MVFIGDHDASRVRHGADPVPASTSTPQQVDLGQTAHEPTVLEQPAHEQTDMPRPQHGDATGSAAPTGRSGQAGPATATRPELARRVEFWGDPPAATAIVALGFALVRDPTGRVLLARRVDTGNWELPGGCIEPGETVSDAVIREVAEETGLTIAVTGLAGVFCDPTHVVVYPERGEARQQHVTLVHAVPAAPTARDVLDRPGLFAPRPDGAEIDAAAWIELDDLASVPIHPSVHRRLDHALRHGRGETNPHLD